MGYRKIEEVVFDGYEKANEFAEQLFAPYGSRDDSGSRTTLEAKVRIRASANGTYRVILYTKKKDPKETVKASDRTKRQKRPRSRRDRKGSNDKAS